MFLPVENCLQSFLKKSESELPKNLVKQFYRESKDSLLAIYSFHQTPDLFQLQVYTLIDLLNSAYIMPPNNNVFVQ